MIERVTGKNALTNYGFYGCYCGWGGAVGCMITAMGGWRRKAATSGHSHTNTDFHGDWSPVSGPPCQAQLCACDRKLVYCLKRNLRSYNPRYQYFPNILC
ncbi:hypothetical protein GH733_015758 [Mirounga leonina]|nr:hypothetical protein GH733_015758 [Mirounga leonina]